MRLHGAILLVVAITAAAWLGSLPDAPKRSDLVSTTADARAVVGTMPVTPPPAAAPLPVASRWVEVTGSRVRLRTAPDSQAAIIDSLLRGTRLMLVSSKPPWQEVRDPGSGRTGWMHEGYVRASKPEATQLAETAPSKTTTQAVRAAKPSIDDETLAKRVIQASIAQYSGSCACPFNVDRAGRACGKRSAWSRVRGHAPLCYRDDVTPAMLAAARAQLP